MKDKQLLNEVARFQAIAGLQALNSLNEDMGEYAEGMDEADDFSNSQDYQYRKIDGDCYRVDDKGDKARVHHSYCRAMTREGSDALSEAGADWQSLRDAYLVKLKALSNAELALHDDDGLFAADPGAKQMYDAYMKSSEANNDVWTKLYRYVQSEVPPRAAPPTMPAKPGAPPARVPPPSVRL